MPCVCVCVCVYVIRAFYGVGVKLFPFYSPTLHCEDAYSCVELEVFFMHIIIHSSGDFNCFQFALLLKTGSTLMSGPRMRTLWYVPLKSHAKAFPQ